METKGFGNKMEDFQGSGKMSDAGSLLDNIGDNLRGM